MRYRSLLAAPLALAAWVGPSSAELKVEDYFKNEEWSVTQHYIDGNFDSCVALKNFFDNGVGLTIGRAITGDDYIIVNRIAKLLGPGEDKRASGSVSFDGKAKSGFKDQIVSPSTTVEGEKYITVYMSSSFTDDFARAFSVEIFFANGSSKHPLIGSRRVINQLDACTDAALAKEKVINRTKAPAAPAGWSGGTADSGSPLIYTQLPTPDGAPKGSEYWLAYVKNSKGTYDLRFRNSQNGIIKAINPSGSKVKRDPFAVKVNGKSAFTTLITYDNAAADILDILPGDLLKLGKTGSVTFTNLDPEKGMQIEFSFNEDAAAGAESMVAGAAAGGGGSEISLEGLVGKFYVRGRNPNGKLYFGRATTSYEGGEFKIDWVWTNEKKESGTATLIDNIVTSVVPGYASPAVYKVGTDGIWRGTWDNGKATEVWVPIP